VTKGYIDSGTLEAVVGAIVTLGTAGYGLWVRRQNGLITSVAAAIPDPTVSIGIVEWPTCLRLNGIPSCNRSWA
jgi:hypothetical protein